MNTSTTGRQRHRPSVLLLVAALVSAAFAWSLPRATADAGPAPATALHDAHGHDAGPRTPAQAALHDQMRKLWEDHVTWTRLAIVTFADGSAGFPASAGRLLSNQIDLGNAIKPYFGEAAGAHLTGLLHDHITIAVQILQAARAGNGTAFAAARDRWYANANAIADFLSGANPRFWSQQALRADMRTHLDQTLAEADAELHGSYAASVADYDVVHTHILGMADLLTDGIVARFPSRFH